MSRLDPLRERQDYFDAIEADRELREGAGKAPSDIPRDSPSPNPPRSVETPAELRSEARPELDLRILYDGDRGYRVRASQIRTLVDVGKFRIVGLTDIGEHLYPSHSRDMQEDLAGLLRQGLLRKAIFEGPENTPREFLTLSKRGHRLIRANRLAGDNQAVYWGFVKFREANHDADLYKLYNAELTRITKEGGSKPRVILDFELKRGINRDLARLGRDVRPEIAASHGLRIVRDRIPVPDLRIEYERPGGETARVDLELVTEHYRGRSIRDKAKAGFALYTARGEADWLRRVLDAQELTAEILSL